MNMASRSTQQQTFTLGPWYCPSSAQAVYKDIGDVRYRICDVDDWGDDTAAIARLIAAAPDLLEALKSAVSMDIHHPNCRLWLDRCHAAIAKAEGQS